MFSIFRKRPVDLEYIYHLEKKKSLKKKKCVRDFFKKTLTVLEEACGDISFLPNLLFCFSLAPPSLVIDSISGSFVTEICINILKLRPDMTSIFDLLVEQEISGGNHLGSRQCRSTPSL